MVHYICARVVALCYFMHAVRHTYRHHKYRFPFCSARPPLATAPLLLAAVVFPTIEFDIRPPTPLNGGDCSQHPPIEIHGRAVKKGGRCSHLSALGQTSFQENRMESLWGHRRWGSAPHGAKLRKKSRPCQKGHLQNMLQGAYYITPITAQ